ncbi:BRO family protein [Pseudomonas aeruginosa]|nr:BRO family protein [Pseudomonas aeruginosa]
MHGHTQLAPHYFFRQQRSLRALLIDDQAWFVLDDFARLIEHSQPEQMLARLDDDQARRESLRSERGEDQAQWLISESGAYAALIYQQRGDGGEIAPLAQWRGGAGVAQRHRRQRHAALRQSCAGSARWCTCSTGRASSG